MFLNSSKSDVAISIGGTQFTGKNVVVSQLNINQFSNFLEPFNGNNLLIKSPDPVEIEIKMQCSSEDLKILDNLFESKFKIRNKLVGDCSIEELLFAVRQKIKI